MTIGNTGWVHDEDLAEDTKERAKRAEMQDTLDAINKTAVTVMKLRKAHRKEQSQEGY